MTIELLERFGFLVVNEHAGWTEYVHPDTNEVYYANKSTSLVQAGKPFALRCAAALVKSKKVGESDAFEKYEDDKGGPFFFDKSEQCFSWCASLGENLVFRTREEQTSEREPLQTNGHATDAH